MTGTGIEPMCSDFQSDALPLSYPVKKNILLCKKTVY